MWQHTVLKNINRIDLSYHASIGLFYPTCVTATEILSLCRDRPRILKLVARSEHEVDPLPRNSFQPLQNK